MIPMEPKTTRGPNDLCELRRVVRALEARVQGRRAQQPEPRMDRGRAALLQVVRRFSRVCRAILLGELR